ncbi:Sn1-specific diacylglycerol lipase alpha [Gracilariopsis chorda]|uniref:Sn1-specific diacylglycerol lipase alpha n=1 Tax=Gracilariopsis chorda TaxID=448386 RepID=A0A2V3IYW3_9FLOR|nr:Sn1-specific diacylglycerol lipase alpha [Gracilariopsis chorda]|eukprot:PXF47289.1 Sn1-specific diacylglycerol lipase alpha [Gracilariopsis chorda]
MAWPQPLPLPSSQYAFSAPLDPYRSFAPYAACPQKVLEYPPPKLPPPSVVRRRERRLRRRRLYNHVQTRVNNMSALIGLGPLLDPEALSTIARQLWSARTRLHLRMGGNLPSAAELYLAFQSYMGECDRARMEEQQRRGNTSPAGLVEDGAPDLEMLAHYLAVADAAYARTTEAQKTVLGQLGIDEPLASRLMAETCNPGYLICYDQRRQHLVLSIRGSKEMSDFITNLSAELEEFLTGHGHRGVVRSARGLFHQLLPTLVKYTEVFQPSLFVVVGHSLGAAVASAFTMLLRHVAHMDRSIKRPLRYPKCFAYASPPFLTRRLATHSANCDITTLVTHLDLVPRLCPASVDRLLLKLSQHDWGRNISTSVGRAVESVAGTVMGAESARNISRHVENTVASTGTSGIELASRTIGQQAQAALQRANGEVGGGQGLRARCGTWRSTRLCLCQACWRRCELLSPPAAPPPPLLPLPLPQLPIITLSEDTRACRYRRLLRIQHRRRVRRNAPPSRSTRNTPVRDEAALNRRAARVIRNREVALRARQKQKELMKTLESENCSLKNRATSLELENSTLKMRIDMLRRGAFLDLDVSLSTAP